MKGYKAVIVLVVLLILTVNGAVSGAYLSDLVNIPTAYNMSGTGVVSGEIQENRKRIEAVLVNASLEIGGELDFHEGETSELALQARIPIFKEMKNRPAIAMGLKNSSLYLVSSKEIAYNTRVHLGYGNDYYDGFFAGINKIISPTSVEITEGEEVRENSGRSFPPMNIMAEYVNKDINLGLQVNIRRSVYFKFALLDLHDIKAGIGFAF